MDGVLLDSEKYITRAAITMFREKGYTVKFDDFKAFTGMGENRFIGGVAEKYGIPFHSEEDKKRTYDIYAGLVKSRLKLLPGVEEFINECRRLNLKTAVATSADETKMIINLEETGLSIRNFDATVNGLEIEHKKPDPEIFLRAAEKLDTNPSCCLVIEDAVSGVRAAKSAGCKCLALTTSFPADKLGEADWIAENLAEAPSGCLRW